MNGLLGVIGLACRAGKIKFGTEQSVLAVRSVSKPALVCISNDASFNTVKKLTDSCRTHNVEFAVMPISKYELGKCIGKTMDVSAIAVTDENFRKAIKKQMEKIDYCGDSESAGGAIHGSNKD